LDLRGGEGAVPEAQVNREGAMNKLKMLALTALAAATIGTGALAAAPSASAMPAQTVDCGALKIKYRAHFHTARILYMINNPELSKDGETRLRRNVKRSSCPLTRKQGSPVARWA
jgi:hypothetical protein